MQVRCWFGEFAPLPHGAQISDSLPPWGRAVGHDAGTQVVSPPLRGRVLTLAGRVPFPSACVFIQRRMCSDLFINFLLSLHYLLALPSLWVWVLKHHQT